MAITCISICNRDGDVVHRLESSFALAASPALRIRHGIPRRIRIYDGTAENKWKRAYETITADQYVSAVSGVNPDDTGYVWIGGDKCLSWTGGEQYDQNKLTLYDMCPACGDCQTVYRLKRMFEWCKIMLNTLKDINLYKDNICDTRRAYLVDKRMAPVQYCQEAYQNVEDIFSRQLLGQFATVIHMWNYLVSISDDETTVTRREDNTSGLTVATSHTVASCSDVSKLTCIIDVTCTGGGDGVSAYVPTPTFTLNQTGDTPSTLSAMTVSSDGSSGLHKKYTFTCTPLTIAGTYSVTLVVLPFRAITMYDDDGNVITTDDMSWATVRREVYDPSGSGKKVWKVGSDITTSTRVIDEPTESDYRNSKKYIGKAATTSMYWAITVTWSEAHKTSQTKTSTSSYALETAGVAVFDKGQYTPTYYPKE